MREAAMFPIYASVALFSLYMIFKVIIIIIIIINFLGHTPPVL